MSTLARGGRVGTLATGLLVLTACLGGCASTASMSAGQSEGQSRAAKPTDTRAIANGITPTPQPPRVGGLIQTREAPFGTSVWRVDTAWSGPVGQRWLQVYAGGPTTPDGGAVAYGAVRVFSLPLDPNAADQTPTMVGDFAPSPHLGALTIASVQGDLLTLTDTSRKTVHFDVTTDRFTA
jgi:hypothetical protein